MRSNHDLDSFIRPSYRRVALGAICVLGLIGLIAAIGWSALGSSEPAIVAESNDKVPAYSTSTTAKEAPLTSITTISEASADLVAEPAAIAPQSTVTNDQSLPKAIATTSSETSTTSLSAAFVAVPVSSPSADFYPLGNPYSVKPLGNVLLWQSPGTGSRCNVGTCSVPPAAPPSHLPKNSALRAEHK